MVSEIQVKEYLNNLEVLIENSSKLKKQEIIDEVYKLYEQIKSDFFSIDIPSNNINDDVIITPADYEELEFYKQELRKIIDERENEIEQNKSRLKPMNIDLKPYTERIVSKLNILFRKKQIVLQSQAESLCLNNIYLEKRYHTFISLIEWINDNGISILIDRMLFCSYLNISADAYDNFLNSNDETIKSIFQSIENMYISQKLNASEIGTRNSTAIRTNLSYSKIGAGLTPKDNDNSINNLNKALSIAEIIRKAQSLGYNPNEEKIIEVEIKEK